MDVTEQREINQFSLATYSMNEWNRFDGAVDQAIAALRQENQRTADYLDYLSRLPMENPEEWKKMNEQAELDNVPPGFEEHSACMDIVYRDEEIYALVEMKVIHAYKQLELLLAKLLTSSYADVDKKDFYRWEAVVGFLKSKAIHLSDIAFYEEVWQLRLVNNMLKHEGELNDKVRGIPEFVGKSALTLEVLEDFYERVKAAPYRFLQSLAHAISEQLYTFNESKLEGIARSLALRMDEPSARLLVEKLMGFYTPG